MFFALFWSFVSVLLCFDFVEWGLFCLLVEEGFVSVVCRVWGISQHVYEAESVYVNHSVMSDSY